MYVRGHHTYEASPWLLNILLPFGIMSFLWAETITAITSHRNTFFVPNANHDIDLTFHQLDLNHALYEAKWVDTEDDSPDSSTSEYEPV